MQSSARHALAACVLAAATLFWPAGVLSASTLTPTPTSTPATGCTSTQSCTALLLSVLNRHRARHHLALLQLAPAQSHGMAGCAGSIGHSVAMAATGGIWHTNGHFPRQSFPRNICVPYTHVGENVGQAFTGSETGDLQVLDQLMMRE